jgi:serine/threonine protein kinase
MAATSFVIPNGEILGGYRILDVIGLGGMAVVYRAEQISLGREVALKVLAPTISRDAEFRERFRREGKAVALLDHPNIIAIHDSGEADGRLYLAMRLVRGRTLAQRIGERSLTASEALALLLPIADALHTAHQKGFVHRDVKPQNILIDDDGRAFLADFGIATDGGSDGLTATGGFIGSCYYAAPEQIQGEAVTPAADVYALSAVLFQVFTGQVPYPRDTESGIMQAHLSEPIPSVAEDNDAAVLFNRAMVFGMAKDPADRYGSPRDLLNDISAAFSQLPDERRVAAAPFRLDPDADQSLRFTQTVQRGRKLAPRPPMIEMPQPEREFANPPATSQPAEQHPPAVSPPAVSPPAVSPPAVEPPAVESQPVESQPAQTRPVEERPATQPAPSQTIRRRRFAAAAVAVLIAVGAAVVLVVGTQGGSTTVQDRLARAGVMLVHYRQPWTLKQGGGAAQGALASPTLQFDNRSSAVSLGPLVRSANEPAGVPPALAAVNGKPASVGASAVGGHAATEYVWSKPGSALVAIVIPTTSADFALLCSGPATSINAACQRFAAQTSLPNATVIAPGTDQALQQQLARASTSSSPTAHDRVALRSSRLTARAPALRGAEARVARAAAAVLRPAPPQRFRTPVVRLGTSLRNEGVALRLLAAAAHADRAARFNSLIPRLVVASSKVRSSVRQLAAFGFELSYQPVVLKKIHIRTVSHTTSTPNTAGTSGAGSGTSSVPTQQSSTAGSTSSQTSQSTSSSSSSSSSSKSTPTKSTTKTSSPKGPSKSSSPIIQQGGSS